MLTPLAAPHAREGLEAVESDPGPPRERGRAALPTGQRGAACPRGGEEAGPASGHRTTGPYSTVALGMAREEALQTRTAAACGQGRIACQRDTPIKTGRPGPEGKPSGERGRATDFWRKECPLSTMLQYPELMTKLP